MPISIAPSSTRTSSMQRWMTAITWWQLMPPECAPASSRRSMRASSPGGRCQTGAGLRLISARRNRTALSRRPPSACAPFSFTVMRAWPSKRKSASSARKRGLHRMHRKTRKTGHTSCLDYPGPAPNAPGSRNWLATSRQRKGPTAAGTRATACQATPTRQARLWWPCAMPAASRLPTEPGRAGFGSCYRPRPLMVHGMLVRACTRPRP